MRALSQGYALFIVKKQKGERSRIPLFYLNEL